MATKEATFLGVSLTDGGSLDAFMTLVHAVTSTLLRLQYVS
jgi:hypothetical protein